jgi:hypothetical protein
MIFKALIISPFVLLEKPRSTPRTPGQVLCDWFSEKVRSLHRLLILIIPPKGSRHKSILTVPAA